MPQNELDPVSFADEYLHLFQCLGLDLGSTPGFENAALAAWETANEIRLPPALRDYYSAVGNLPINRALHSLHEFRELTVRDNRVEFMIENQGAVIWAVSTSDCGESDPYICEGVSTAGPVPWVWSISSQRCSNFLKSILHWQVIESMEFVDIVDADPSLLTNITDEWTATLPRTEQDGVVVAETVFSSPGQYIGVLEFPATLELHVAASSQKQFSDIGEKLGLELNPL